LKGWLNLLLWVERLEEISEAGKIEGLTKLERDEKSLKAHPRSTLSNYWG
jgi:hypothetical protein